MTRNWVWSGLDLVALICLGQASMMAQRLPEPLPAEQSVLQLDRAERTRIYETPDSIVVAGREGPARVEGGLIKLGDERIPIPAGADAERWSVRRVGGEVRVVFAKTEER